MKLQNKILGFAYTERQRQRCNDASNTGLIENNAVTPKWVATPFWSDSIVFNEKRIASVITELSQHHCWHFL